MSGAKPRQQAVGHVLGVFAGALASVPIFYAVFLGRSCFGWPPRDGATRRDWRTVFLY